MNKHIVKKTCFNLRTKKLSRVFSIIEKHQGAENMGTAHTCYDSMAQTEPSAETVDDSKNSRNGQNGVLGS